jgi:hypothetical protein
MGFPTKVQVIQRERSRQWYVSIPSACAQMMDLRKGEVVEWVLTQDGHLLLRRTRNGRPEGSG